jgi:transcriptional regulator with XRE-family HTH domain
VFMTERRGPLRGADRRRQEVLLALLRAVCEEKGFHQTDIANALGHPQSFVSKYESGARRLDLLELKDVCDAVGVDLADFINRFEQALNQFEEPGSTGRVKRQKPRREK